MVGFPVVRTLRFLLLLGVSISWLQAQTTPFESGAWVGNVTTAGATAAVRLRSEGAAVRWVLSESAALTKPIYSASVKASSATGRVVKLDAPMLKANTLYYYGFEVDGVLRGEAEWRGRFRTFPNGAASFKIVFGSCGDYRDKDQRAYEAVLEEKPLVFINTGDLHYSNTNSTNVEEYRKNYDSVLSTPAQAELYRNVPVAYVWDDHDYAGNDSDGTSIGRDAARQAYGDYVPHYPRAAGDGTIGQAFTVGRVRVIMTDLRSASAGIRTPDNAAKVRLGATQMAWFKRELLAARDAGYPLILWVNPVPWISVAGTGADDWGIYATERKAIANFIKSAGITNMAILSGDMHGIAFDDGRNADYADGGGAAMPVMHGAALTRDGSVKGGPYSGGAIPGRLQYGVLEITDTGGASVQAQYYGKRVGEGARLSGRFTGTSTVVYSGMDGTVTTNPAERALTALSSRDRISSVDGVTIVGFVIGGVHPRTVLIRAVGPSLAAHGVSDALPDPMFTVHKGSAVIAQNDNWMDGNVAQLKNLFTRVGAGPLTSSDGKDAALAITLSPGVYTAVVRSADGKMGTVLAEIFEVQ